MTGFSLGRSADSMALALRSHSIRLDLLQRQRRALCCAGAAGVGLALTLLCFWPGYMTVDGQVQLVQAQNLRFSDWHPPMMALVWKIVDRFIRGPGGLFLLHCCLYWAGLALLAWLLPVSETLAALVVLLLGFFPTTFLALA